ncbi:UNVERIFIED_CONTAM: putative mitochondrial protein [Sesamum calycinum]|uniref:Mitochondrial protein n=1 Tax=Sesamum calycinum TaxID=2727403 RepID=A0AAW2Q3F7_9LAMI
MGDRNTKFFHDMVKRNATKSSILAITKTDGSTITVVTPVEVKQAIFHISDNKAPGQDGYSACFFKRAWHIVGDQVCTTVLDFFRSGRLLRQLNHSIIAIVPKSDHYPTVADYRPISCCNVIYKAIMKIIADRLAPALEQLTDRCQVLHGYSFPHIFIAWIIVCVSTSSFLVALNGSFHGFFMGKKGLRQGDPMSPALFLLCMEYFSRLIKRKTTDSDFNFHPKREKLKITHLLFADDLMMFSRGDLPSIHILMECLQEFRDVSGLTVNTSKSSIFTAGIENNMLREILARTEFAMGEMPVRWAAKSLSFAGRLELIRSVIQGVSVSGYKSSHSQWRSSRKSIGFVGIFSGTPNEHQLLGRISVIPKIKAVLVSGIPRLGTWPSLPEFYGTSTARQTRFGYSGSTLFISKEDQFGTSNQRRAIHHSFNGLPKSAAESLPLLARLRRQSSTWPDGEAVRDLIRPKHMSTSGQNEQNSLGRRLSTRDRLMFLQEDSSCSLCINTQETAKHLFFECPFSDFVWINIRQWLGISRHGCTSSRDPWKERFFHVRDPDWGFCVPWTDSPIPSSPSHDLKMSFIRGGLFDEVRRFLWRKFVILKPLERTFQEMLLALASLLLPPYRKATSEVRGSIPHCTKDATSRWLSPPFASGGNSSKRPRDASSDPISHGMEKGYSTYGTNQREGVVSYWDAADFQLGPNFSSLKWAKSTWSAFERILKRSLKSLGSLSWLPLLRLRILEDLAELEEGGVVIPLNEEAGAIVVAAPTNGSANIGN